MRELRCCHACGREYELTSAEKRVLTAIQYEGETTAKELREDMLFSRGYLVKIIRSLLDQKRIKTIARGHYRYLGPAA